VTHARPGVGDALPVARIDRVQPRGGIPPQIADGAAPDPLETGADIREEPAALAYVEHVLDVLRDLAKPGLALDQLLLGLLARADVADDRGQLSRALVPPFADADLEGADGAVLLDARRLAARQPNVRLQRGV